MSTSISRLGCDNPDAPVYICERGAWGRAGCGGISGISAFRYTVIHESRGGSQTGGWLAITDAPVCICEQGAWGRGGSGRGRISGISAS
jgi:hypothetical protein